MYASFLRVSVALHLGAFDQPTRLLKCSLDQDVGTKHHGERELNFEFWHLVFAIHLELEL